MKHVPISKIKMDDTIQIRAVIDAEKVDEYAERMQAKDEFPAVDLFESKEGYYIGDGWHRILAAEQADIITIKAEVHKGGRSEALKFALSANARHGLPRSNADKRRAVEVALKEYPDLTDRAIAEICAVGHVMVNRMRPTVSKEQLIGSPRLGRDGKIRRMPTPREPEPIDEGEGEGEDSEPEPPRPSAKAPPDTAIFVWRQVKRNLDAIPCNDVSLPEALNEMESYIYNKRAELK